jgi:hypothetical protein
MERLKELITQLKEQFDRKAEPSQMLETARLLEAELRFLSSQPAPARVMPTKIAVMMPSAAKIYTPLQPAPPSTEPRKDLQYNGTEIYPEVKPEPATPLAEDPDHRYKPAPVAASAPIGSPASVGASTATAVGAPATTAAESTPAKEKTGERGVWPFDQFAEKPRDRFTLSQKAREVNDVIGANGASSLNDKLRSDVTDLKSALNDTPVRDLKKAIGVNDRYVFINQLFRGDEVMYERSIKTINGFRILPEAEYWMERELKVKLGWDENREITRHFYQLVKRRFS